ncbi:MAG: amidohydrolase family protein [Lacipirellulaceae bacterium]
MADSEANSVRIIDSHHHFWHYTLEDYGWMDDSMVAIRRDFLPTDLQTEISNAGVEGVVSVQARQSLEETRMLCDFAGQHDFIKGVVGWVPLLTDELPAALEEFSSETKLKAVRHVVQDEPDDFLLRDDFNEGVALLAANGLVYDVLIFERQLPAAIEFVDKHTDQSFVLDHIAKPKIGADELEPWRTNLLKLAERENIVCKLSGMVTEADYQSWTPQQLQPYLETVLEAFGPKRLMFGTDWPVCTLACEYQEWVRIIREFAAPLTETERHALFFETANQAYHLQLD